MPLSGKYSSNPTVVPIKLYRRSEFEREIMYNITYDCMVLAVRLDDTIDNHPQIYEITYVMLNNNALEFIYG